MGLSFDHIKITQECTEGLCNGCRSQCSESEEKACDKSRDDLARLSLAITKSGLDIDAIERLLSADVLESLIDIRNGWIIDTDGRPKLIWNTRTFNKIEDLLSKLWTKEYEFVPKIGA